MNKPKSLGFSIIEVLIVVVVVFVLGALGYAYWSSTQSKDDANSVIKPASNIYFVSNNKLYDINVDSKDAKIVDSVDENSDIPMNSRDLSKVAYVKDNSVYIYDGANSNKIDQPVITDDIYQIGLLAWSSTSQDFVYSIKYSPCMVDCGNISQPDEDKSITGAFWYSFSDKKSTKLPIAYQTGIASYLTDVFWVPMSNQVAYSQDISGDDTGYNLRTYDVITKNDELLTKTPLEEFSSLIRFSDDGTKIIYGNGYDIISANADNSNQSTLQTGAWADYQKVMYSKDSTSVYVYEKEELIDCGDREPNRGDDACAATYVVSSKDSKKLDEIVSIVGNYDKDSLIVISGRTQYSYKSSETPVEQLSIINIETGNKTVLYSGDTSLNMSVSK